jgi:hypothetical protein
MATRPTAANFWLVEGSAILRILSAGSLLQGKGYEIFPA